MEVGLLRDRMPFLPPYWQCHVAEGTHTDARHTKSFSWSFKWFWGKGCHILYIECL